MTRWGYRTVLARQFDQVEETFFRRRPQLVLMDVNLPYYDGFYWCARLRRVSAVRSSLSAAGVMTG